MLSFALTVGGLRWVVAAGVQEYHPGAARDCGRAAHAHNTLTVDDHDETSFQKRYEYVTVVNDLEAGRVLWVGDHRRASTLREFWESRPLEERAGNHGRGGVRGQEGNCGSKISDI